MMFGAGTPPIIPEVGRPGRKRQGWLVIASPNHSEAELVSPPQGSRNCPLSFQHAKMREREDIVVSILFSIIPILPQYNPMMI